MNDKRNRMERRKCRRFNVKDNIFAVLKPHYGQMGQLLDVNKTGLSFQYIDCADCIEEHNYPTEVMIFIGKGTIYIDHVPIKSVFPYDIDDPFTYNASPKKRMGLEFGELNFNQLVQVEYFILNHTWDTLEDRRKFKARRNDYYTDHNFPRYNAFKKKRERRSSEDRRLNFLHP